jgi:hypothetical protein
LFYLFIIIISISEIKELGSLIVILSHTIAANSVGKKYREPESSDGFSIKVLNPPSLDYIFSESSKHIMEIEVLIY